MGEAKKRRRALKLAGQRCLYCAELGVTEEHFPPRAMFLNRHRPDEMVFACCENCNGKSRISDLAAAFVARLERDAVEGTPIFREWEKFGHGLARNEPDFLRELLRGDKLVWARGANGLLQQYTQFEAGGPVFERHMRVFALKCGMALFRRHIGEPLPLTGVVYAQYYLNSGMPLKALEAVRRVLPNSGTLRQGTWSVADQFYYMYNANLDEKLVSGAVAFHRGLQVVTFALAHEVAPPLDEAAGFFRCNPGHLFN